MEEAIIKELAKPAMDFAKKICVENRDCYAPFKIDTYCCTIQCCNIIDYLNTGRSPFDDKLDRPMNWIMLFGLLLSLLLLFLLLLKFCSWIFCSCFCEQPKKYYTLQNDS